MVLLAGCSTTHPPPGPDTDKVHQFAGRGYLTDDHFNVTTSFHSWPGPNGNLDIALMLPARPGTYPLVIYLPGLGETRSAGEAWRMAWAQAGYAVMSVQPLREDAQAWSSIQARNADFSALARERYSASAMATRFDALHALLDEVARRGSLHEAPFDRIDATRVAVAGFDIGAYTASVLAGETMKGLDTQKFHANIAAVIVLSPYADFGGLPFVDRYQGIGIPALTVTGNNDIDSLGVVSSPSLRKAPFEYMTGPDKWQLFMFDVSHSLLSGDNFNSSGVHDRAPPRDGDGDRGTTPESRSGGRGGKRGRGTEGDDGAALVPAARMSPTEAALRQAAVQSVTTAFLDTYLKQDEFAREWMDKDARQWLRDKGQLSRK